MIKDKRNPHAVALGALGGAKKNPNKGFGSKSAKQNQKTGRQGGNARAANMTPEQRSESARKAAMARWETK